MKRIITVLILALNLVGIAQAAFSGNRESKVFHREGCRYFHCKNCTVTLLELSARADYRAFRCVSRDCSFERGA